MYVSLPLAAWTFAASHSGETIKLLAIGFGHLIGAKVHNAEIHGAMTTLATTISEVLD